MLLVFGATRPFLPAAFFLSSLAVTFFLAAARCGVFFFTDRLAVTFSLGDVRCGVFFFTDRLAVTFFFFADLRTVVAARSTAPPLMTRSAMGAT